jgi:hypothetical protein
VSPASLRPAGSVLVLLVGAGVYALVEGPGGATFYLTPAFIGLVAVIAGLAGPVRHLIGSGLALAGWGTAVLLVHYHHVPSARTTPAYMIGVAVGVLVTRVIAPKVARAEWMTAAAAAATFGAVGYYFEFAHSWLGRWPAWCLTVVAWGVYLGLVSLLRPDAGSALVHARQV